MPLCPQNQKSEDVTAQIKQTSKDLLEISSQSSHLLGYQTESSETLSPPHYYLQMFAEHELDANLPSCAKPCNTVHL
jgi:hypothetical protein